MKNKDKRRGGRRKEVKGTGMRGSEGETDVGKGSPMLNHLGLSRVLSFISLRYPLRYSYLNNCHICEK